MVAVLTAGSHGEAGSISRVDQPSKHTSALLQPDVVDLTERDQSKSSNAAKPVQLDNSISAVSACIRKPTAKLPINIGTSKLRLAADSQSTGKHATSRNDNGLKAAGHQAEVLAPTSAKTSCPRCAEPEYGFMPACKLCHTKYHAGCLGSHLTGASSHTPCPCCTCNIISVFAAWIETTCVFTC